MTQAGKGAIFKAALGVVVGASSAIRLNRIIDAQTSAASKPKALPVASSQASVEKRNFSVYQGLDDAGNVNYVGITGREPQVRFLEHLNSGTEKSLLRFEILDGATGLSKINARILEQGLINQYGLGKTGGQLLNRINSISPSKWSLYGIK